jgi:UDP:flavonoid glycosyltransferase YjiC (YdhE family)
MTGKRIVFCTFGSLGDIHPILALAREMKRRGHSPVSATSPVFVGDVIRSVNGILLTNTDDLRSERERFKAGDPAVLEIERQDTYQFVSFDME